MPDVREDILVRLLQITQGLAGVNYSARNVMSIDEDDIDLPAVVLLDGDEVAIDDEPSRRPSTVPRRFEMTPMLHVVMGSKPEDIGTDLNVLRSELIGAVVSDSTLLSLVDRHGIRYDGLESARNEAGRLVVGQRFMRFTFTYLLVPAQL